MKILKKIALALLVLSVICVLAGCDDRQATQVSYNVSKEADNFNVVRRIAVINARSDEPLFELVGAFSLSNNRSNELEIICQTGENQYKKHFVYLNQWTMYVVEDISGADVSPYHYEINYLPEMIVPIKFTSSY